MFREDLFFLSLYIKSTLRVDNFSFFFFLSYIISNRMKNLVKLARVHLTQSIFVVLQPLQNNRGDVEIVERLKSSTSRTVPLT